MENKNIKRGLFNKEELTLYKCLTDKDVDTILEYQEKLPILSEDDDKWINGRQLHKQLGVGKHFTTWIIERIAKYKFEKDTNYIIKNLDTQNGEARWGGNNKTEYMLTLDMAKQLCMVQNNELGIISRQYFILIEKAFKERTTWNGDRLKTIGMFHELNEALDKHRPELEHNVPSYWGDIPLEKFEYSKLNQIILGKSATDYRAEKHIKDTTPIRNTFSDSQLDTVHKLEQQDAFLIDIQNMYDWSDREELLIKYYKKIA